MKSTTKGAILTSLHVTMALFGVFGGGIVMAVGASSHSWALLATGFLGVLVSLGGILAWVLFFKALLQEEEAGR